MVLLVCFKLLYEFQVGGCSSDMILFAFQMSHLFNMFVKQVQDYCGSLSMPGEFLWVLTPYDLVGG
jgi:hypothetical protein